jgi:hypothetical protein
MSTAPVRTRGKWRPGRLHSRICGKTLSDLGGRRGLKDMTLSAPALWRHAAPITALALLVGCSSDGPSASTQGPIPAGLTDAATAPPGSAPAGSPAPARSSMDAALAETPLRDAGAPPVDAPAQGDPEAAPAPSLDVGAPPSVDGEPVAPAMDAAPLPVEAGPLRPGGVYKEVDGVVSMEMERGKGNWKQITDGLTSAGRAVLDPGPGSSMSFRFTTQTTGKWYMFLRAKKGTQTPEGDDENDVLITVDGQKLWGGDDQTRPDGMRVSKTFWVWTLFPKGPGGTTPDAIRSLPAYALIEKPGTHELLFKHRSPNFGIDKIVLKHEARMDAKTLPTELGPPETE